MSEHTKEPWHSDNRGGRVTIITHPQFLSDGTPDINGSCAIAQCFGPDAVENSRRIVACVNACAGIPTDQIQKDIDVGGYEDIVKCHQAHIEMVEKQRDKLLAASKSLRKAFGGAYHVPHSNEEAAALMGIDEAIAEVEAAE